MDDSCIDKYEQPTEQASPYISVLFASTAHSSTALGWNLAETDSRSVFWYM